VLGGVLVLAPAAAAAQHIRATVVDSATGAAVDGVLFSLIDTAGRTLAGLTDGRGQVAGRIRNDGPYLVTLTRIGYRALVSDTFHLSARRDTALTFTLAPEALTLPTLEATAPALERHLSTVGYYERKKLGFGHFVDPDEVDRRRATAHTVGELLQNIPGVSLEPDPNGMGHTRPHFTGIQSEARACGLPRILVDNVAIDTTDIESAIHPQDVLAMEVYRRPSEIPPEYGGATSACGVLVIWTRRGGPAARR
jgi:TonB-dependent Receptor Plug Domain